LLHDLRNMDIYPKAIKNFKIFYPKFLILWDILKFFTL